MIAHTGLFVKADICEPFEGVIAIPYLTIVPVRHAGCCTVRVIGCCRQSLRAYLYCSRTAETVVFEIVLYILCRIITCIVFHL